MLNEEKIKLMTKLAAYEQEKGKNKVQLTKYLKSDYIGFNTINTIISATIAFILLTVAYIVYNLENLTVFLNESSMLIIGEKILALYVVFIIIYFFTSKVVYAHKYNNNRESVKEYYAGLKKLSNFYEKEDEIVEGEDIDDEYINN